MSASYVIEGNLSEKQIEADVAKYFGWCAWGLPFDLRDVDEPLTGADKLSNVTVPIYAQFKKSTGLRRPTAPCSGAGRMKVHSRTSAGFVSCMICRMIPHCSFNFARRHPAHLISSIIFCWSIISLQ
ncbi:hypothetical protein ACVOMT_10265 [Sphingomonas panni]